MAQAFFGGVHPNDMKAATNEKAIEQLEAPAEVVIPMSMHIGAPCKPIVAVGDKVTIGQKIGEPGGFVSAPIHASVSGTVKAVEPRPFSMGGTMMSVVIENDFQNTVCPDIHPVEDPDSLTPEQLVEIVKNAGIVGMGGATFPTHVKITSGIGKVNTVIINGAECEPYITGDHRTMLERPEEIIGGAKFLAKMFGVDKVVIGVEDNKRNGIDAMNKVIAEQKAPVVVEPLRCRYPQGGEKQLCQAITGREVPPGGLPADIGCAVFNINTTCAIYRALTTGMPVVRKIVTVSQDPGVPHRHPRLQPVGRLRRPEGRYIQADRRRPHDGHGPVHRGHLRGQGHRRHPGLLRERGEDRGESPVHPLRQVRVRLPDAPGAPVHVPVCLQGHGGGAE